MLKTLNQYLQSNTDKLNECYQIWNSPKYGLVQKGSYHSVIGVAHRWKAKEIFTFFQTFKFDVDVIQRLGAAKNSEQESLYDESFLNMLQRLDIEKSVKFTLPDMRSKGEPVFEAKGSLLHLMIIEVLLQAFWNDAVLKFNEN
jgi:nicotinic acid phosphoribosyltransferase